MKVREVDYSARAARHDATERAERVVEIRVDARAADDGGVVVEGFASITGSPYAVRDWLGEYDETIAVGAFRKTLQESADVRWLVNHDGIPLARTASGTLDIREITDPADDPQGLGQTGLWTSARMDPVSPLVQTVRSAIERGDMSQMSFAFRAVRQEWNEDYSSRIVREAQLFDVSGVTYPANPATTMGLARNADPVDVPELAPALGEEPRSETMREAEVDRTRERNANRARARKAVLRAGMLGR